jgi:syntaxin 5
VFTLQSKLASMTSNFKEVLEVRTENLKEGKSRQEMFAHQGAVTSSMPQSAVSGYHSGSVLAAAMADDNDRTQRTGEVAISMGGVADQQRSFLQADATDQYLASRADTMQNIETTIVELGGIFSQLAHMIKEQEEIMVRIRCRKELRDSCTFFKMRLFSLGKRPEIRSTESSIHTNFQTSVL